MVLDAAADVEDALAQNHYWRAAKHSFFLESLEHGLVLLGDAVALSRLDTGVSVKVVQRQD